MLDKIFISKSDIEFVKECLKKKEEITAILQSEMFDLRNGKAIVNFNNEKLMDIKLEYTSYKREKKK